ncbi:MAG: molybdenum cofactor guanylyltransferase [Deltaproteobacteria bacterium]|nr:molybdenum cofactor guanylyltransferase [Deltaproteobacteria bacterium]
MGEPALTGLSIALLCGGRSMRFGADKLRAQFKGEPLLAHSVKAARALGVQVALVHPGPSFRFRDLPLGDRAGLTDVIDAEGVLAPLAGVVAALRWCPTDALYVCGGDMPFAPSRALIERLQKAIEGHEAAAPVLANIIQPLCTLLKKSTLAKAEELLAKKAGSPFALLREVPCAKVVLDDLPADAPERMALFDIDTRADLEKLDPPPAPPAE